MTNNASQPTGEFDQNYAGEQLRRSRHPIRRFVKGFYLRNLLCHVNGATIDFGCGAGQLLQRLPAGSVGLEVNPYLIEKLRADGFVVHQARADMQDFELNDFAPDTFRTLVIAHVLEHLSDPIVALKLLLAACRRLGVERVVVVVPGEKGYASDRTHKTFIDKAYLEANLPINSEGFIRSNVSYFPGSSEWIGRYFIFHEMKVIFDRANDSD